MSEESFLDNEDYIDLGGHLSGNILTAAGQSVPPPSQLIISFTVEFAPESDAVLQNVLFDLTRREAEFRAERAEQITRLFDDIKHKSLHKGYADYRLLLADVRKFTRAVKEIGNGTGVKPQQCCMYLKDAAITGLAVLAEHRPHKHARFQEELVRFCESGYVSYVEDWFKGNLWGDLGAWASAFDSLLSLPPGLFSEKLIDARTQVLNDVEVFVNFLLLACLSRVGNGL